MTVGSHLLEVIRRDLVGLRRGQALGRPMAVLELSAEVRGHLLGGLGQEADRYRVASALTAVLTEAIDQLRDPERIYVRVDLNLADEHRFPTLTERQESLAHQLRCAAKTVRRHADLALDSLAYLLAAPRDRAPVPVPSQARPGREVPGDRDLRAFWRLEQPCRVDIVCSEIPPSERPYFADPADRNYLRYAKFADLDSLIYLRTRLAQLSPTATLRDFSPSEHYDTHADVLVVVGGPPWNAKYREFLPHLPFSFEPRPLGEDDPLVVPQLGEASLGPRWTARHELIEDIAVFTRMTLAQGTTVFLLGGCLTLGVLGAAHCFLDGRQGARSARYVDDLLGDADFVLVAETRRVGGITEVADVAAVGPLLLLARQADGAFEATVDNTKRYRQNRPPAVGMVS
ncbi:hypothetical protein [Pseudofrankia sp. BMG5.37]|uniref:hypothetical protein n=1 Tax=Pseudofrankia sp. BMG5.37 TaxID=3050035 RepID=UPI0028949229|nr:hypothetical protein [Pseudofrankia sp. BMG5.37]MDT3444478.1 hypothetical protein [Pseudofrankia sp. BMG5.37]